MGEQCDRCPQRAVERVVFGHGPLWFCQHHLNWFLELDEGPDCVG